MRITEEYAYVIGMGIFWGWLYEAVGRLLPTVYADQSKNCFLLGIRTNFLFDLLRSTAFPVILNHFSVYRGPKRVKADLLCSLDDFSLDLECQTYFRKYLSTVSNRLVEEYNKSIKTLTKQKFGRMPARIFGEELTQHFVIYKHTVSFDRLYSVRRESDELLEAAHLRSEYHK